MILQTTQPTPYSLLQALAITIFCQLSVKAILSLCPSQELLKELTASCEGWQPKLFRMASETEEGDEETLREILGASDELTKVIDR